MINFPVTEYTIEFEIAPLKIRIWQRTDDTSIINKILTWYHSKDKPTYDTGTVADYIGSNFPQVTAVHVMCDYEIPVDFLGKNEPKRIWIGTVNYTEWP